MDFVVADCTGVGVGTDDTAGVQAALNAWAAGPEGSELFCSHPRRLRMAGGVSVDLGGKRGMKLNLSCEITPDNVGNVCTFDIRNAYDFRVLLRVLEGGKFNGWESTSPYPVDYSSVGAAVENGGCEFLRISNVNGYFVDLDAYAYAGRVLHTLPGALANPLTQGCQGTITTALHTNPSKPRTGQAVFAEGPSGLMVLGDWGELTTLTNNFDAYGSTWKNVNDIRTPFNSAFHYSGMTFLGCGQVNIPDGYVGDIDGAGGEGYHVYFGPSAEGRKSFGITGSFRFLNSGSGIFLDRLSPGVGSSIVDVTYIAASSSANTALVVNDSEDIIARVSVAGAISSAAYIHGSGSDAIIVDTMALSGTSQATVFVDADVVGRVSLGGDIRNTVAGIAAVVIGGIAKVQLREMFASTNNANTTVVRMPATNKVRFVSGAATGATLPFGAETPAYLSPGVEL